MKLSDFQNLDPANIGGWPAPIRAFVIVVLCAAVLGAGYWFDTKDQMERLDRAEAEEIQLKDVFETKQRKAANLEPLKNLLKEMKQSFGAMLRLLPNRTEIEGLLVDISQSGLAAGLEFELFKPGAEQPQEFYAIQPINITVTGNYHEMGEFISAVAALPRIVTQHNLKLTPMKPKGDGERISATDGTQLRLQMVARTYRYLDEEEIAAAEAAKKKDKKGRKKRRRGKRK